MRKNLEVDVPKGAHTEVQRKRALKKSIFTRTRIAVLSLILVLSLSVTGTLAYLQWTANQTPNRMSMGDVSIKIGEKASIGGDPSWTGGDFGFGRDKKVVFVQKEDVASTPASILVSIVPEVESKSYTEVNKTDPLDGGYLSFNEEWSALKQETDENGTVWDYIETSIMKVYLAQNWSEKWTFQSTNGIFRYNESLEKGQKTSDLISGVVLQDSAKASDYKSIKLSVIAQAVQA